MCTGSTCFHGIVNGKNRARFDITTGEWTRLRIATSQHEGGRSHVRLECLDGSTTYVPISQVACRKYTHGDGPSEPESCWKSARTDRSVTTHSACVPVMRSAGAAWRTKWPVTVSCCPLCHGATAPGGNYPPSRAWYVPESQLTMAIGQRQGRTNADVCCGWTTTCCAPCVCTVPAGPCCKVQQQCVPCVEHK